MKRLRILLVADCTLPIPPAGYGGAERMIADVAIGMLERGHQVSLLAGSTSLTGVRFISFDDARTKSKASRGLAKARSWTRLWNESHRHDLIQSAARLDYMVPALRSPRPKIIHFQHPIDRSQVDYVRKHQRGRVAMVPAGHVQMEGVKDDGLWCPIYNGIPTGSFRFQAAASQPPYLLFLGRITRDKGTHTAIEVARKSELPLVIAGNIGSGPDDRNYYSSEIAPAVDGTSVTYVGEVGHEEKNDLLAGATALLFPIEWDEPMGMVQLEALACGTPVIASSRGESPRLLDDGITGFVCDSVTDMIEAVRRVPTLDRSVCRRTAEERFDVARMLDRLEDLYRVLTDDPAHGSA